MRSRAVKMPRRALSFRWNVTSFPARIGTVSPESGRMMLRLEFRGQQAAEAIYGGKWEGLLPGWWNSSRLMASWFGRCVVEVRLKGNKCSSKTSLKTVNIDALYVQRQHCCSGVSQYCCLGSGCLVPIMHRPARKQFCLRELIYLIVSGMVFSVDYDENTENP